MLHGVNQALIFVSNCHNTQVFPNLSYKHIKDKTRDNVRHMICAKKQIQMYPMKGSSQKYGLTKFESKSPDLLTTHCRLSNGYLAIQ